MKIFHNSFSQILTANFWSRCYFVHLRCKETAEVDRGELAIQVKQLMHYIADVSYFRTSVLSPTQDMSGKEIGIVFASAFRNLPMK